MTDAPFVTFSSSVQTGTGDMRSADGMRVFSLWPEQNWGCVSHCHFLWPVCHLMEGRICTAHSAVRGEDDTCNLCQFSCFYWKRAVHNHPNFDVLNSQKKKKAQRGIHTGNIPYSNGNSFAHFGTNSSPFFEAKFISLVQEIGKLRIELELSCSAWSWSWHGWFSVVATPELRTPHKFEK